ncbi:uncharacterized protein LOC110066669 [Orbicella faveolata]|uniref:uncharacterized protein LOC110066669 n=1 Tax=Orbicella faveolata TaxID=48498 RepID=UPI0009E4011E|nr:uncharacterized protein LOC110066669 [Orbicella faveolata]
MIHWLVTVISLWVMLQSNLVSAKNFTDLAYYEDYEANFVKCPNVIKVEWNLLLSREPHVIKYSNGTEISYDGLFPQFLHIMLEACCADAFEVKYVESDSDIILPVILNYKETGLQSQSKVVPILPYTGVAFVVKRADKKNLPIKTLSSVFSSWPVLVITLLLSVLAGIVAWILDTRKNKEEFPVSFIQGSWEGFWWAFISMTTVGYGDRCPKSISGRLFAIFWILTGICMCSIFTAMLTTALTTISLDTEITLPRAKVAALFGSIEATTGFQRQAEVIRVHTIEEIKEKITDGEAVGALMDSFTITHYQHLFPVDEFKVQEVISQEYLEYGAQVENSSMVSCLKNFRFSEESELYEQAELYMANHYNKSGMGESLEGTENSFEVDPEGLLFYPTLFTSLGILAFFLLSGATWEICRRSRMCRMKLPDTKRLDMLLSTPNTPPEHRGTMETKAFLQELEEKFVQDVRQVLKSLENDLINRTLFPDNNCNEKLTSV